MILTYSYCLQKSLKEKEEHIEQLLKERELERGEVFVATDRLDEVSRAMVVPGGVV